MITNKTETASSYLNALCVALVKHAQLLKAGLTPYEAQCAIFTGPVEQALDALAPQVQENFGLYLHYQVEQFQKEKSAGSDAGEDNVISMTEYIVKKDQQQETVANRGANAISQLVSCTG